MRQIGIVKSLDGNRATISVSRKTACESCAAKSGEGGCSGCMTLATSRELLAAADNTLGAKVGDRVVVETDSNIVIGYAAAVFLLPLLLGVAGYFVGGLISTPAAYIVSVVGFVAAFAFLYFGLNRRAEKRCDVKIVSIIPSRGDDQVIEAVVPDDTRTNNASPRDMARDGSMKNDTVTNDVSSDENASDETSSGETTAETALPDAAPDNTALADRQQNPPSA